MARRRGNKEGSIYKYRGGRWCAQISLDGKRLTFYSKSKRECQNWIMQTKKQIQDGMPFDAMRVTLDEYLLHWLKCVKTSIRIKTWNQYFQIIDQHIIPEIGRIKLCDLRPDQVQTVYSNKREAGKTSSTLRIMHAVLHRALNQAVRWGFLVRNPASVVDKPRLENKEMKILTAEQSMQFLNQTRGTRYHELFHLAITTGLRQGELLGLWWTDLNWQSGTLKIRRQLQRITGQGLVFTEPKSSKSRRLITLGPTTIGLLRDHERNQDNERVFAGDLWEENNMIFSTPHGKPIEPRNLLRIFKKLLKEASLPEIRFHDLRHTAASLMLQEGIHPKIVQERLGHSRISLTLDIYSHVLPAMQQEAAAKLDELLTPIAVDLQYFEK
jgi:integrase